MKTISPAVFLAVAAVAAIFAAPATAFESLRPGPRTRLAQDGKHHGEITREAIRMSRSDIGRQSLARIVETLWRVDANEGFGAGKPIQGLYDARHHFNRGVGQTSRQAFRAGAQYVLALRKRALDHLRQRRHEDAAADMGRALHALQDLCAHSNIVDLPDTDVQACWAALVRGEVPEATVRVKLTGYDPRTGGDLHNDREGYGHAMFGKESPVVAFPEALSPSREKGLNKFERARKIAVIWTAAWLKEFLIDAGDDGPRLFR